VVSTHGGAARILTPELDRNVNTPVWSSDGKSLRFLFVDDGARQVGEVPAGGGAVRRLTSERRAVWGLSRGAEHWAVVNGTPEKIDEIYALEGDSLRTLSHQNDAWLASVAVAPTQSISYRSKDGTEIHGFAVTPPDGVGHRPYPTVVNLHGGPTLQHEDDFNFDWQIMAAHGYLVLGPNVRGSTGRGERFSLAVFADWGDKDLDDVLAAPDWAIRAGLADSARLGVGGYSYGGILTNYVIASTHRFKAAASIAGISDFLASYGTDMWVRESELEVGKPWENTALYLKLSSPFLHADRITTPTLFAGGSADVAVPVRNGMQMYQALRSLGVPTRLVIYPGQYHEGWAPSYLNDLLREYLAWYDRFLLGVQ
jgi:dipeptidyl aminopeptidase/acylaminoacyl peptidase